MRRLAAGELPGFPAETASVRAGEWSVAGPALEPAATTSVFSGLEGYKDAAAWVRQGATAPGTARVNVVVDTVFGCFEAEEILHELRDFDVGLVTAPLGYLFSFIQLFADAPECIMPDRRDITSGTPCIDAYLRHLQGACKRRGARFESTLRPVHRLFADERHVEPADLLQVPHGRITRSGIRRNIATALQFLVAPATEEDRLEAEFARSQLWQWVRHDTGVLDSGRIIDRSLFEVLLDEERETFAGTTGDDAPDRAARLLLELTTADDLAAALPVEGYRTAS